MRTAAGGASAARCSGPVEELGASIRDWVLVDGEWRSTDDKPISDRRPRWKKIVRPAMEKAVRVFYYTYWAVRGS
jgi:hypothetical protein